MTLLSGFVYTVSMNLESIDHLCINPIHRIGLIHMGSIDSYLLMLSVQVNVLLNNCEQNKMSVSLLAGMKVAANKCSFCYAQTTNLSSL